MKKNNTIKQNDSIIITKGPFKNVQAKVISINEEKKRCTVNVFFIDNEYKVDMPINYVKIINEKIKKSVEISKNYIQEVNSSIIQKINNPEDLYTLSPREFEYAIAEILEKMGFEIYITKQTRDNGRDILAVHNSPIGKFLTIVECKKYMKEKKIGIEPIQRLLWVADNYDKASKAMLVTTASFSKDAKCIEKEFKFKLALHDMNDIKLWLLKYGKKTEYKNNIIWTSNHLIK